MSRVDRQVNVRLEAEILERLKAHADETGQSMTAALNRVLEASIPTAPTTFSQFKLRLPTGLYQKIQTSAARNKCSASSEVVRRLQSTFLP